MKQFFNWLKREESGQGIVEYGLILMVVAIAVIVALTAFGGKLNDLFQLAVDAFN